MSAIESGVPDILFARFNLASARLLCPASAWAGGAGHRRRHRAVAGVMTMAFVMVESGAAVARWCTGACVRSFGRVGTDSSLHPRERMPGRGRLADVRDGIVLERGGSGSLCPEQICRVPGDGLKKKNPRRRWRLRGCLYSWRREGDSNPR